MNILRIPIYPTWPRHDVNADWLCEMLHKAFLNPVGPAQQITQQGDCSDTAIVAIPRALHAKLADVARTLNATPSATAAHLIQQVLVAAPGGANHASGAVLGIQSVRQQLHELLTDSAQNAEAGQIVMFEAATGSGKGRAIAAAAIDAASKGRQVIVSAPLAVTWQLVDDIELMRKYSTPSVSLVLGRANFVNPLAVKLWAEENEHVELLDWVNRGGPSINSPAQSVSQLTGVPLAWLLDDAVGIAEDIPVQSIVLSGVDDPADCKAEALYRSLRDRKTNAQAQIILCSHHMLAAHTRMMQLLANSQMNLELEMPGESAEEAKEALREMGVLGLPAEIDMLIVDEAHLLEQAFAAINSHALHLQTLDRIIKRNIKRGKKKLQLATEKLDAVIRTKGDFMATISEIPQAMPALNELLEAISDLPPQKLDPEAAMVLRIARNAASAALQGRQTIRFELSPVKKYPRMIVGRASLENAMMQLWDRTAGAILVSATLYSLDGRPNMMRWKLGIPENRCYAPASVHPDWVFKPVTVHSRPSLTIPDDSTSWIAQVAGTIEEVATQAAGGTLVLATSYRTAEDLAAQLDSHLGERLVVQTRQQGALACKIIYMELYKQGKRPVWLGLGAAWTGIDLSDHSSPASDDRAVSDLVIPRLPMGVNRTLQHERRVRIRGFGVVRQETSWYLRQGIGRLVRREGVAAKNLWLLDPRIYSELPEDKWATAIARPLLAKYNRTV